MCSGIYWTTWYAEMLKKSEKGSTLVVLSCVSYYSDCMCKKEVFIMY